MSERGDLQARADRLKVGHLVAGIVLVGIAVTWALHAVGAIDGLATGVVLPVLLVAAGVVGLAAMLLQSGRQAHRSRTTETEEEQS